MAGWHVFDQGWGGELDFYVINDARCFASLAACEVASQKENRKDPMADEPLVTVLDANGWRFSCRMQGAEGEPVLLLHGFPESSAMWRGTMRTLANAGFQCAAPDQRGYSAGARPTDVEAYAVDHLVADVFAIADALGWRRFHLVAHDQGAGVAWCAATAQPERLASLTILSVPHCRGFAEATWSDPDGEPYRRVLRLILAPDHAAERVWGRNDMASFRESWPHHAPEEVEATLDVFRQPGALTAALAWYRASDAHRRFLDRPIVPIRVPTVLIWGRDDPYIHRLAVTLGERIPMSDYRRVELDAGHWLVQERADEVHAALLQHLRSNPCGPRET